MSNITRFQYEQMQARMGRPVVESGPPLEKKLHREIMDHCDAQWPRWKYVHSRMDKATRNEIGVPDFVILLPWKKFLVVEAKRPGEKPTPAQRDWHAEAARLDHPVQVVHDLPEFLQAVQATLKPVRHAVSNPPP
jgi:hypothetical protein